MITAVLVMVGLGLLLWPRPRSTNGAKVLTPMSREWMRDHVYREGSTKT